MANNKNAVIRYLFLDDLLSDQKRQYTCLDLLLKCNAKLIEAGYAPICSGNASRREDVNAMNSEDYKSGKRLIQMDIKALQEEPFNMEIDNSERIDGAPVYKYKDPTRRLFKKQLSDDEKKLLKEVLNTLGKFSGVDSFAWIQDLKEKLSDSRSFGDSRLCPGSVEEIDDRTIISFETNEYLKNKEYLSQLFYYISNRQTITVKYQKFTESEAKSYTVYPYMLKQYSNRWYLLCTPAGDDTWKYDPELIMNLPLDRFAGEIKPEKRRKFRECAVDLNERFEDIVGITYMKENPVDKIIFAIKMDAVPFIETKPIHESQKICLDMAYHVDGYKTFSIECRYNYELLATLSSFGEELIVLTPSHLREKMLARIQEQLAGYQRTDNIN